MKNLLLYSKSAIINTVECGEIKSNLAVAYNIGLFFSRTVLSTTEEQGGQEASGARRVHTAVDALLMLMHCLNQYHIFAHIIRPCI